MRSDTIQCLATFALALGSERVNGDGPVFATGRHAVGRYNDETKARPFRAFQDHLSYSLGGMDSVDPNTHCFLHDPARYPGIKNLARPANSNSTRGSPRWPRSKPQQQRYW